MTEQTREPWTAALDALREEFAGVFGPETVESCLRDSYELLLPASVHGHLPLLAHRFTRERLRAASRTLAPHSHTDRPPLVLFVCTANSGRSQLAAALLAQQGTGMVQVASAGTRPAHEVQSEVLPALAEVGVTVGDLFPKPLTEEVVAGADVVVTMGCHDTCAVLPGRRYLDWEVTDPAGLDLDGVRAVRDQIADRVTLLLAELATWGAVPAIGAAEQPVRPRR